VLGPTFECFIQGQQIDMRFRVSHIRAGQFDAHSIATAYCSLAAPGVIQQATGTIKSRIGALTLTCRPLTLFLMSYSVISPPGSPPSFGDAVKSIP
jgi:hypothetical protein